MKRACPRPSGFSLVEVALSLAILAVGMVGVLALLPVGLDAARQVEAETVAAFVARSALGNLATNARTAQGWARLIQPGDGQELPESKEYWLVDGIRPEDANNPEGTDSERKYFELQFLKMTHTPGSCRYMLQMRWPAKAARNNPNGPLVQKRAFVIEILPAF